MQNKLFHFLSKRLFNFDDNTRVFVLVTLSISILITSFTFFALNLVQENSLMTNNLFCQDLGILVTSRVIDILDTNNDKYLISFLEKIYISTSSIRYILLFRVDGSLFVSIPTYSTKIQDLLQLHQNLLQLETHDFLFNTPLVKHSTLFNDHITDVIIPLIENGQNYGSLYVGINSSSTFNTSFNFIYDISSLMFVLVWFIAILVFAFNSITIIEPIEKLLNGIKDISYGNFKTRINIQLNGKISDVIFCFNQMAQQLEYYENQHINKLSIEKNKLEVIVSTIADGAILVDTELRILFINQVAKKIFDLSTQDLIGKSIVQCFPLHISQALLPLFNYLVKHNCFDIYKSETEEIFINLNYDVNKIFRFVLTTIVDQESGILTGLAIIVQDIDKETSVNQAKNQFMSNVSHELRTPLCNISSFLETLLDYNESLAISQKTQFLKIAYHETKRLSRLVNDILDLSHIESHHHYHFKQIDLFLILNNVLQTFHLIAEKNHIDLVLEIDPCIKHVLGHESSLCQVLSNLLSNAMKFTNYSGQVVIRAYVLLSLPVYHKLFVLSNNLVNIIRIEIIDEGIGIEKINQKVIFDRFIRIENNIHILQGTGLGLSIVENILQKYQSTINVNSFVTVGTSFSFDLLQFF